jgi:hypothetical protein
MESLVMRKFLALGILFATLGTIDLTLPQAARAEYNDGYIGPSVTFGDGQTAIGINAKMRLGDNFSFRPYWIPSVRYGASLTYDFRSGQPGTGLAPFIGFGWGVNNEKNPNSSGFVHAGLDANLSEKFTLFTGVTIPTRADFNSSITVGTSLKF